VIVINGGLTDKTLEIFKNLRQKIKIINQKNREAVKTANKGFKKNRGEYVIKLDYNDYSDPNILKEIAAILDKTPEVDFVYNNYYEKSKTDRIKIVSTKKF
jgi:glycosyltransferase involved in cell wall biosynthesis